MNCGTAILWVNKPVYTLEPETVIEWSTTTELTVRSSGHPVTQ